MYCSYTEEQIYTYALSRDVPIVTADVQRSETTDIERQLRFLSSVELRANTARGRPLRDELRERLDALVAAQCALCGDHVVDSIDRPFIADQDWPQVLRDWE
ncbi:hypothetical protein ACJJTC_013489 [Scirpophaga incertulas]